MDVVKHNLPGVLEITPPRFGDDRGFFSETWNAKHLADLGIENNFVQDNHSLSRAKGVLRGLHFQRDPFAQDKLVRVTRGAVFDVAVDIRKGSPHFGHWVGVELTAEKGNQLFVPRGFAHGFLTLTTDTEFLYKVTNYYSPEEDRSIRFDDPAIGITWPMPPDEITLSDKDLNAPLLADSDNSFVFNGDH
ncbi:MAG: dTDP-4-dehydrorhamnose 3,5-epimerase [Pseudomonadota bacterium]